MLADIILIGLATLLAVVLAGTAGLWIGRLLGPVFFRTPRVWRDFA